MPTNQKTLVIHRKIGESIAIGEVRITLYQPRPGRITAVVKPVDGIPVFRVDGETLTELPWQA